MMPNKVWETFRVSYLRPALATLFGGIVVGSFWFGFGVAKDSAFSTIADIAKREQMEAIDELKGKQVSLAKEFFDKQELLAKAFKDEQIKLAMDFKENQDKINNQLVETQKGINELNLQITGQRSQVYEAQRVQDGINEDVKELRKDVKDLLKILIEKNE